MNRDEFMAQLARLLADMPETERMEAIRYYNDYFDEAGEENESKVIQELGSPGRVAASIKANLQEGASSENAEQNQAVQNKTTENGYRETWHNSSDWSNSHTTDLAASKPRTAGKWALLIILLVCASPVLLGVGGGLLGGILGLLGGLLGVVAACLASSIGLIFGGAALMAKGIINIVSTPGMGLTGIGGGLLFVSLGLLLMVLFLWFCFQIVPRLFRTIVNFVSRILHKGKGMRQNEKN